MAWVVIIALGFTLALPVHVLAQSRVANDDEAVLQCCWDSATRGWRDAVQTDREEMSDRLRSARDAVHECHDCATSYLRDTMNRIRSEYDPRRR